MWSRPFVVALIELRTMASARVGGRKLDTYLSRLHQNSCGLGAGVGLGLGVGEGAGNN